MSGRDRQKPGGTGPLGCLDDVRSPSRALISIGPSAARAQSASRNVAQVRRSGGSFAACRRLQLIDTRVAAKRHAYIDTRARLVVPPSAAPDVSVATGLHLGRSVRRASTDEIGDITGRGGESKNRKRAKDGRKADYPFHEILLETSL
jgi:hypothetical protein